MESKANKVNEGVPPNEELEKSNYEEPCDCPKDKDGECIPMTELEKLKIGHKVMSNSYKLQIEKLKEELSKIDYANAHMYRCDKCEAFMDYDDAVHFTEDVYYCQKCGVDDDGKVYDDCCKECYVRDCEDHKNC